MWSCKQCLPFVLPTLIALTALQIFLFVTNHKNDLIEGGLKHNTLEHYDTEELKGRRARHPLGAILPAFAKDRSEVFVSSIIERSERTQELLVTTFMLCHFNLEAGQLKKQNTLIHPKDVRHWGPLIASKSKHVVYKENGQREEKPTEKLYCRIKNSDSAHYSYISEGITMPNRLSGDSNANRRLDILRCPMEDTKYALQNLARSSAHLHVEIVRGRHRHSLINFTIPWDTRRTGYLMTAPSTASRFDAWKGLEAGDEKHLFPLNGHRRSRSSKAYERFHKFYLTSPGFEQQYLLQNQKDKAKKPKQPDKQVIAKYVEFAQHHILLGADHIFFAVSYGWTSLFMRHLLRALRGYIEDGYVSVSSKAGDNLNSVTSMLGFTLKNIHAENMFVLMNLYLSKGNAHLMGVWEESEFFIPSENFDSIPEIFDNSNNKYQQSWCYAAVSGKAVFPAINVEAQSAWLGEKMSKKVEEESKMVKNILGSKKVIISTTNAYHAGLGVVSGCAMFSASAQINEARSYFPFKERTQIEIDEMEIQTIGDEILEVPVSKGSVYNFVTYLENLKETGKGANNSNVYRTLYFPRVIEHIEQKELSWINSAEYVLGNNGSSLSPTCAGSDSSCQSDTNLQDWVAAHNFAMPAIQEDNTENPDVYDSLRAKYKSQRQEHREGIGTLPFFAADDSEYFLSSIIERSEESHALYITTFMLCHFMLTPKPFGHKVHAEHISNAARSSWLNMMRNVEDVDYTKSGQRVSSENEFYCKIRNTANSPKYYTVLGTFMPNNLSPDSNANRRLDVLRCRMEDTDYAMKFLARSSASVHVEIIRGDRSLINFTIPWDSRRTGYLMSTPYYASKFDAWKGLSAEENVFSEGHNVFQQSNGETSMDTLYLCAPGLESIPNRKNLALYLEFVQHNLLQGVEHIFLSVSYGWDSVHMKNLTDAFRSYIDEGTVTISSQSADDIDFVYSFSGMSWGRDNIKNMAANMFLYLSKGTSKYLGIWDYDEFFVPKLPYKSIVEIIKLYEGEPSPIESQIKDKGALDRLEKTWETSPTMADCSPHPWCYITFSSSAVVADSDRNKLSMHSPWIGDRFDHGPELEKPNFLAFKKSILPTTQIWQAALHKPGGCRLPQKWTSCADDIHLERDDDSTEDQFMCFRYYLKPYRARFNELLEKPSSRRCPLPSNIVGSNRHLISLFHADHNFDEMVLDHDAKSVDMHSVGMFYHFQAHREFLVPSIEAMQRENEYTKRFFPAVLAELKRRGLVDFVMSLPVLNINSNDTTIPSEHFSNAGPEGSKVPPKTRPDMTWTNYSVVFRGRFDEF